FFYSFVDHLSLHSFLHDALPISDFEERFVVGNKVFAVKDDGNPVELQIISHRTHKGFDLLFFDGLNTIDDAEQLKGAMLKIGEEDRKSTRLNSSHVSISYAVFCL